MDELHAILIPDEGGRELWANAFSFEVRFYFSLLPPSVVCVVCVDGGGWFIHSFLP